MKYLPWVGLLLVLFLGWSWHERKVGELNGRIAHLVQEKARVDTVYRADTLRLTKWRTKYDTVRALVLAGDTSKVRRLIYVADSTLGSCNQVVETCEVRLAIRDSIISVLKKKPSVWSHLPWVAAGVLGGILLTR